MNRCGDSKSSPVLVLWLQAVTQIIFGLQIDVTRMDLKMIFTHERATNTLSQNEFRNSDVPIELSSNNSELMIPRIGDSTGSRIRNILKSGTALFGFHRQNKIYKF